MISRVELVTEKVEESAAAEVKVWVVEEVRVEVWVVEEGWVVEGAWAGEGAWVAVEAREGAWVAVEAGAGEEGGRIEMEKTRRGGDRNKDRHREPPRASAMMSTART